MSNITDLPEVHRPDPNDVMDAIAKRSYCTLATVSPAGRPHVAGVLYEVIGDRMYINTTATSRKWRNVAACPHVAVVVPVRRVPVGATLGRSVPGRCRRRGGRYPRDQTTRG